MNKKKRMLFLTPFLKGARGNVFTTQRICAGYRRKGYEVRIFAYTEGLD